MVSEIERSDNTNMDDEYMVQACKSTPWKLPRPNPIAFASAGALQRKQRHANEPSDIIQCSFASMNTPQTPSKALRSKFVIPGSLTPFALSPNHLIRKEIGLPSDGLPTARSKLTTSVDNRELFEDNSVMLSMAPTLHSTRSSSPLRAEGSGGKLEDIFGSLLDDDSDDGMAPMPDSLDMDIEAESFATSSLKPLPWKSQSPVFFTPGFHLLKTVNTENFSASEATFSDYFSAHFEILDILGRGSFSSVFRVRCRDDGQVYAIKRSNEPFSGLVDRERRLYEVENMWRCAGNVHCVRIISAWEQHGYLHIQMELCENGSLADVISYMAQTDSRFTEHQIWQILRQIAEGLEWIHRAEIVHLDIKPANIFITQNGVLKIGDFGLSTRVGMPRDPDSEGDKYYMAPEVLDGHYDRPADVFSLGLLILELAADVELPAQGESWQNLRHGDFSELSFDEVSDALSHIIRDMTDPDPIRRLSINTLLRRVDNIISSKRFHS